MCSVGQQMLSHTKTKIGIDRDAKLCVRAAADFDRHKAHSMKWSFRREFLTIKRNAIVVLFAYVCATRAAESIAQHLLLSDYVYSFCVCLGM